MRIAATLALVCLPVVLDSCTNTPVDNGTAVLVPKDSTGTGLDRTSRDSAGLLQAMMTIERHGRRDTVQMLLARPMAFRYLLEKLPSGDTVLTAYSLDLPLRPARALPVKPGDPTINFIYMKLPLRRISQSKVNLTRDPDEVKSDDAEGGLSMKCVFPNGSAEVVSTGSQASGNPSAGNIFVIPGQPHRLLMTVLATMYYPEDRSGGKYEDCHISMNLAFKY